MAIAPDSCTRVSLGVGTALQAELGLYLYGENSHSKKKYLPLGPVLTPVSRCGWFFRSGLA